MPLTEGNEHIYRRNYSPLCPYCDFKIGFAKWDLYELYEENDHFVDCPNCEREFILTTEVSFRFSTDGLSNKKKLEENKNDKNQG